MKIRGFRIELGEIEAALSAHAAIRESVVTCDEYSGEKRLIAYLVCQAEEPSVHHLRDFLGTRLPEYMIPARFVFIDSFPLTINGKIDRRNLPRPARARPTLRTPFVAPVLPPEKTLAAIWAEMLDFDQVGVNDNFFELGGDSIRSIQVLAKAQQRGLHFSLQKLFQHPTIAALTLHLQSDGEDQIEDQRASFGLLLEEDRAKMPAGVEDAYPLSKLQHGMVFHSDYDPQSAIFHDVFSYRLKLPYDETKLKKSVARLVERHNIYRTSFDLHTFSEPLQLVHQNVEVPFSVEDLRGQDALEQKQSLICWVEREKRRRFDWDAAPLMRLHVQLYGDDTFQFIVSFHHAIMDGWSLAVMLTELFQEYGRLLRKPLDRLDCRVNPIPLPIRWREGAAGAVVETSSHRPAGHAAVSSVRNGLNQPIPPPGVTYRDFVRLEQRAIASSAARTYWANKISDAVIHTLPRWLESPRRGGREQVRGPEVNLPRNLLARLKELANEAGLPIRSVLLAAHCRVLSALTGQTDIMTGLVANGRPQCLDGEKMVGLFLNTVPLRVQVNGGTWRELIRQTFQAEQELLPHRRYPLSEIQQLAAGKTLFETVFDFVQFHVYRDIPGYEDQQFLEDHYFEANNFNFFVTFMLDASASELQMHFDYNPNEFCDEQISLICEYYSETLQAMAFAADKTCAARCLLPAHERRKLLEVWNDTRREVAPTCVQILIEQQVERTPNSPAIIFEGRTLTYGELNAAANALALRLRELGVGPEVLVGIHVARSLEMLVCVLGVLKAGGAYVPLDPAYPPERLAFMSADAGLQAVLTTRHRRARFETSGHVIEVDGILDTAGQDVPNLAPLNEPDHLAYVIYTSGSTGQPKGVQIPHRALANFLQSMLREPGLQASDTLLAVTTLSFDIAGLELFLPLLAGARLVIAGTGTAQDPAALADTIAKHGVTVMQATPTTWAALVESNWAGSRSLKALCGGEPLSRELANQLLNRCSELWNLYGPTETTIWSTLHRVQPGAGLVPIGQPIANTEVYILDSCLIPVPTGTQGEIYLGGEGLARGYLNRPDLSKERFIPHPFKAGARLYRTGDLGQYRADGKLLCAGRIDHQVKVRGFRIELGEIEAALERHPGVARAVLAMRQNGGAEKSLAAYWIGRAGTAASGSDLRAFLERQLPAYMVPSVFVCVSDFPLTPNGKIDRHRLPEPAEDRSERPTELVAPRTPFEKELADIWQSVLKAREIGIQDNFFELGGNSLLAMRALGKLRSCFDASLTVASFFEHPTIESYAIHLLDAVLERSGEKQQESVLS
ncbi:MAG: amino acid adenylation domain-containing protein [Verrucomicrobiales bacterium]|nr:amino acid adenylation domain-containing protein [Verrucomicrobiales bacterium]